MLIDRQNVISDTTSAPLLLEKCVFVIYTVSQKNIKPKYFSHTSKLAHICLPNLIKMIDNDPSHLFKTRKMHMPPYNQDWPESIEVQAMILFIVSCIKRH